MIKSRPLKPEDYKNVSQFLNETYLINKDQRNWLSARWEYAAYFVKPLSEMKGVNNWETRTRIWETSEGNIVGVVSTECSNDVYLHVHPEHASIQDEMLNWAEDNLKYITDDGNNKVTLWAHDNDNKRKEVLLKRGYKKKGFFEALRWQSLETNLPEYSLPQGYRILSIADGVTISKKGEAVVKAFNSTGLPLELYYSMQSAPLYRSELDLVSIFENNTVSSFCTAWFDDYTKTAMLEPCGTHPEHRKKGLGKAVIIEALYRLKFSGAKIAYVGSYGKTVGDFYTSAGFNNYEEYHCWEKNL